MPHTCMPEIPHIQYVVDIKVTAAYILLNNINQTITPVKDLSRHV